MAYLLQRNCLPPVKKSQELIEKENEYNKQDLNNILDEQILISQLSNGITFMDTNEMDSYERKYVLERLFLMKKEEVEAKNKAIEEARRNR